MVNVCHEKIRRKARKVNPQETSVGCVQSTGIQLKVSRKPFKCFKLVMITCILKSYKVANRLKEVSVNGGRETKMLF
jgi:hypothetical protein